MRTTPFPKLLVSIYLFALLAACNLPAPTLAPGVPTTAAVTATPAISAPSATPMIVTVTATPPPTQPPAPPSPEPTLEPTQAPTRQPATATVAQVSPLPISDPYAVILVAEDDTLNVRQEPGTEGAVVDELAPQAQGLTLTGQQAQVEEATWVEIRLADGTTGWVNAYYLTEYVSPEDFCDDERVLMLFGDLERAVANEDGNLLSSLISPRHGLDMQVLRTGRVANYSREEAKFVFASSYAVNWGVHPASGLEVVGTFREQVLPPLEDVFLNDYTQTCNTEMTGGVNYMFSWPYPYGNINFYSLFKPGSPEVELDWRTWLVGVEYVGGEPFLFAMQQYFWEP